MKKFTIAFRNQIQAGNVLELYFLDTVDDYIDWDAWEVVSLVQDVINKVNQARPSRVVCYINSEGGSCDIGLAIYSFLKYANVEVETRTLALAGSIASVLQQAASPGLRYIAKSAFMVIHKAWGYGAGNASDLRQTADVIDAYTDTIVGIYSDVTGKPKDEIAAMIEPGDYWMTGEEAVAMGFADAIFDDVPDGFSIANSIRDLDAHYTNLPEKLRPTPPAPPVNNNLPQKTDTMSFNDKMTSFFNSFRAKKIDPKAENLADEVANVMSEPMAELIAGIDEEVNARISSMETAITNNVTNAFKTQMDALVQNNTDLTTKIGELEAQNGLLVKEIADNKGGESGTKIDNNAVQPIGFGVKRTAEAEA